MNISDWVIRRKGQYNDYWSNTLGWAAYDECDHFSQEEREMLRLPIDGYWSQQVRKRDMR